MSELIALSDMHYGAGLNSNRDTESLCEKGLVQVYKYSKGPIFWLGDVLNKANMPTDTLLRFEKFVWRLSRKYVGIQTWVCKGNHELTVGDNSSLELIDWPKNFHLVNREVEKVSFGWLEQPIYIVPYLHTGYVETIKSLPDKAIVMSHVLLDGVFVGTRLHSKVRPKIFDRFTLTLLGDVHRPQRIRRNIYYCGNFVQTSNGDIGNKQGFIVYDGHKVRRLTLALPEIKRTEEVEEEEKFDERLAAILTADTPVAKTFSAREADAVVRKYLIRKFGKISPVKKYLKVYGAE